MTVVEKYRPRKTWSELSPKELMEAISHLGPKNLGERGTNPLWLISFIEQSTGEGGLTPEQAEKAKAIIDELAPQREQGTVILK